MISDVGGADQWITAIGGGATRLATRNFGCLVVNPRTGEIWSNASATELFGRAVTNIKDLEGPDVLGTTAFGLLGTAIGVKSGDHYWFAETRVGVAREPKVVHVGRFESLRSEQRCLVVHIEQPENRFVDPTPEIPPLQQLTFVHDQLNRVICVDRRLTFVGMDPALQVGLNGFVTVHLEDQVKSLPYLRGVLSGALGEANYSIRVIGPEGKWTAVRSHARALVGGDAAFVTSLTFDESARPLIPIGVLSERETEVVRYLFIGLRTAQIALVLGVSAKTVRNQLSAVYSKLGVSGQVELLDSFHLPARQPKSGLLG